MDIKIHSFPLNGEIIPPVSKSDLHRKLICAALCTDISYISISGQMCQDIEATVNCLNNMGAKITQEKDSFKVIPIDRTLTNSFTLNCGESGSTLRFLLPVASSLGREFTVTGTGKLPQRPLEETINLLKNNGLSVIGDKLPLTVNGKLKGNSFTVDGSLSSQFVSGILFTIPLLTKSGTVKVNNLQSKKYVDMTIDTMSQYGITIAENNGVYSVKGQYKSTNTACENDWSNGAFFLCSGAISKPITVKHLNINSIQGDKEILNILKQMGANVTQSENTITISPGNLEAITLDASQIPDLVPILSVVMSLAKGTSRIIKAQRLKFKESDRLNCTAQCLNAIGGKITVTDDGLKIQGIDFFTGGETDSFNDHRLAMSVAIASLKCKNDIILKSANAVEKSYPDFWNDFNKAGGKTNVIYNG